MKVFKASSLMGIMLLVLIDGGCGGPKFYTPPDKGATSKIILINNIYDPGFYVELDKKEAGFLRQNLEIVVTPGKHKLKIFNTETSLSEKQKTTVHKFDLQVEVGQGESKKIVLAWDDPNYSREVKRGPIRGREKSKKGQRGKMRERGIPGI